jgi:xylulokinase
VNLHHRRPHLTGAVLEGVGYALALWRAPLRPDRDVTGIDVIGAEAASNTWLALLADIWGVPVRRHSITSQANSVGAAVARLVGLGRADFSIAPTLAVVEAEFAPGDTAPAHRVHLERFVDAYRALRPWFAERESRKR